MKWPVHISQHRSHIWWGVTFKFTTQTLVRGFTCSGKCRSLKECVLHSHWEDKKFKTPAAFEGLWDPSLLAGDAAHITEIIIVVQLWQPKPHVQFWLPREETGHPWSKARRGWDSLERAQGLVKTPFVKILSWRWRDVPGPPCLYPESTSEPRAQIKVQQTPSHPI